MSVVSIEQFIQQTSKKRLLAPTLNGPIALMDESSNVSMTYGHSTVEQRQQLLAELTVELKNRISMIDRDALLHQPVYELWHSGVLIGLLGIQCWLKETPNTWSSSLKVGIAYIKKDWRGKGFCRQMVELAAGRILTSIQSQLISQPDTDQLICVNVFSVYNNKEAKKIAEIAYDVLIGAEDDAMMHGFDFEMTMELGSSHH